MGKLTPEILIDDLRETFYLAVEKDDFKNGAFKGLIKEDTPVLQSLDLFIASPLLSAQEKETARKARTATISLQQKKWGDLSDIRYIMEGKSFKLLDEVFEEDMRKRGRYVAPILAHTFNETNQVTSTTTIDSSGKVQYTPGGALGVYPGAPAAFNAANVAALKSAGIGDKKEEGRKRQTSGAQGNAEEEKKENASSEPNASSDKKDALKHGLNESSSDAEDSKSSQFGNAFEANLRGAFL